MDSSSFEGKALDLNRVALFVQVVRSGSFAAASRRIGVPPNTLSRKIQELERQVGVQLIHRTTRKFSLTAVGSGFYVRCSSAIDELGAAATEVLHNSGAPRGTVRVGAPADLFAFSEIDVVSEFLAEYPEVRLEFVLSDSLADLVADDIDVAFRAGDLPDPSLVARKLSVYHYELGASATYLSLHGEPLSIEALAEHECLVESRRGEAVTWRLRDETGVQEVRVRGRFAANTAQARLKAARAGMGIALMPSLLLGREIAAGRLQRVLPSVVRDGGGLYAVLPSNRHIPKAVSALVDHVLKSLSVPLGMETGQAP